MESFKTSFKNIIKDKPLFISMIFLFLSSVFLIVISIIGMDPGATKWYIRCLNVNVPDCNPGRWSYSFVFLAAGLLFGILHNILAVKLFNKKSSLAAKWLVFISLFLVVFTIFVAMKVLGINNEG